MTKNFRLGIIDNPRKIVKNSLFFPKEFIPNLQKQGIESKIATGFCNFEELYGSIHEWDGFIGHASSIFFGVHESYADKKRIEKILWKIKLTLE